MIEFGWDLCYSCNLRCPYCSVWKDENPPKIGIERWVSGWKSVAEKYGRCKICLSGGEPSTHPLFSEIVENISQYHTVDICTNLLWDPAPLLSRVAPSRVRVSPTFHPAQGNDFSVFFSKILLAGDYLSVVRYVFLPENDSEARLAKDKCEKHGIHLNFLPVRFNNSNGEFVGNSQEQKKWLSEQEDSYRLYYLLEKSPEGKKCMAGMKSAMVRPDGSVDRCPQHEDGGTLGNILDGTFSLVREAAVCRKKICVSEPQMIIEG